LRKKRVTLSVIVKIVVKKGVKQFDASIEWACLSKTK